MMVCGTLISDEYEIDRTIIHFGAIVGRQPNYLNWLIEKNNIGTTKLGIYSLFITTDFTYHTAQCPSHSCNYSGISNHVSQSLHSYS